MMTPTYRRLFSALCPLSAILALPASAERLFVGILEADSFQSVNYSAAAFSRGADLPFVQEQVRVWLTQNLLLPSLADVSASETLRIVQSVDPAAPPAADNPANVALVPLTDDGAASRQTFAAAYATHNTQGPFTLFEAPSDTNLPPRVAVAYSGRHLLASASLPALTWAWENRAKLIGAPSQTLPGTFRILVNPQRLADLTGARNAQANAFLDVDKLLREFETLAISFTLEGAALAVSLRGTPKPGTALDALTASWRPPPETFWNTVPDNALMVSLGMFEHPDRWSPFLGKSRSRLLRPIDGLAPQAAFSGERLLYFAPTQDRKGLCFVQLEPLNDAAPVQAAIRNLGASEKKADIAFAHRGQRQVSGVAVETYTIRVNAPEPAAEGEPVRPSVAYPLLSFLMKKAVLETAVAHNHLITVIGPEGAIDTLLPPAVFPAKPLTLNRSVGGQDPALNDHLTFGGFLRLANLLRHAVSIIPDVKPEQVQLLPQGGDGATFGLCLEGRALTASLRFQSNEIAALQKINRNGRAILQEVVFQMFAKQMLDMQQQQQSP
jgi:hypothetical protein